MLIDAPKIETSRTTQLLAVLVFLLLLWAPSMVQLFAVDQNQLTLEGEKRTKAKWPSVELIYDDFTGYTAQINNYLDDHIGFREPLLNLYAKMRYRVLGAGASDKAIIGNNGWLFLAEDLVAIDGRTRPPISEELANNFVESLNQVNKSVTAYGGVLLLMLVPDKASVYPEFLPKHLRQMEIERRAKPLIDVSSQLDMPFLDLLAPMLAAKTHGQLYHKSDTHWGQLGSFVAYRQIVLKLQQHGYPVQSIDWSNLKPDPPQYFSGDLSEILRLQSEFREQVEIVVPPHKQDSPDMSLVWPDEQKLSLMVVGDSFAARLLDFLPASFANIQFQHHQFISIPLSKIEYYQPKVVVIEIVERQLGKQLQLD